MELFIKKSTNKNLDYYAQCKDMYQDIPKEMEDIKPIFRNILSTMCGKLYYFIPRDALDILMKYQKIFKSIIDYDVNKVILNISKDKIVLQNHINSIDKIIPSIFMNKYILFENSLNNFIPLPNENQIIFDSGNSSVTTISRNIATYLNLQPIKGCRITSTGIGGESKQCGDYVELNFKFDSKFPMTNNKIYTIQAFINDQLKDIILFGHLNGLDLLFNDNYSIKHKYDFDDSLNLDKQNKNYNTIIESYDNALKYLDLFLSNPMSNKYAIISLGKNVNYNFIRSYHTNVSPAKLKLVYDKLYEAEKMIKTMPDELADKKTLMQIIHLFIK